MCDCQSLAATTGISRIVFWRDKTAPYMPIASTCTVSCAWPAFHTTFAYINGQMLKNTKQSWEEEKKN